MWIVSIVSLSCVIAICSVGVFHRAYDDTVFQRIAMSLLCLACSGRIVWLFEHQRTDPSWTFVHFSVALYAVATAMKVARTYGRVRGWWWITGFDRWIAEKQTDAGGFDDRPHHHN